jgi:hypothetical protein
MNTKYIIFIKSCGEVTYLQVENKLHRTVQYPSYATLFTLKQAQKLTRSLNKEASKYAYYGACIGNFYGYEEARG